MHSDGDSENPNGHSNAETHGNIGYLLFDSLVHHLIEKGLLTKNDALSVVQSAAEVVRGQIEDGQESSLEASVALSVLERTYASFEAMRDQPGAPRLDGHNVRSLRPPLHGDRPKFPPGD